MDLIDAINLARLDNGAHFAYHSNALANAKANATISSKCAKVLTPYDAAFLVLDKELKTSQKSMLTDAIVQNDELRDTLYMSYKQMVGQMVGIAIPEMAEAAKILNQHIKDYRINVKAQLDKETGLLKNFIADLQEKYAEQVETLSLTSVVMKMQAANEKVNKLIQQRADEYATRNVGATKQARMKVDEAYRNMILVINAYMVMEDDNEDYIAFAKHQNEEIKRIKQQILGQKPDKKDEEEEKEPVKPEITEVYSKVEDPHDPTGITRGKETIMKWVGDFELVNETGDGPGKIIVKDNFTGVEEEVPAEDILSRSNTGCEFIMIRDFAEGEYKIRIETYDGGSPLVLEYPEVIKLV